MKYIINLILIIYIRSYIAKYYSSCEKGTPDEGYGLIPPAECRKYNPSNGYCCVLSFKEKNICKCDCDDSKKNDQYYYSCYGITKDGYKNINNLVEDLEDYMNLDALSLNCSAKTLNFIYKKLLLILLILLNI